MPCAICSERDTSSQCRRVRKDGHRIERLFLYACIWAFGGCAAADKTTDSRQLTSQVWRDVAKSALKLPEAGLCFEYAVDPVSGDVCEWSELVPRYEPVGLVKFSQIVVATADLVALKTLTTNLQTNGHGVLFVGSANGQDGPGARFSSQSPDREI